MNQEFGRIKLHRLTDIWLEASLIWPAWFNYQGEDEILTLNFFVVWGYLPKIDASRIDSALWTHLNQNMDEICKQWLFIQTNAFVEPQVRYFSINLFHVILNQIWKSNINITIVRKYAAVLNKAATDLEALLTGGFLKLIHVREIFQVKLISHRCI